MNPETTSSRLVPTSRVPPWLAPLLPPRARAWARRRNTRDPKLAGPADVRWCYRLLLGREPDEHGERGFLALVTDHAVARDDLVSFFVSSPEFRSRLDTAHRGAGRTPVGTAVDDLTIYVDPDDGAIGSFLRRTGTYEPDVTAAVRHHLRPGDCFVDVGASFGYFSALAGTIVGPTGRVVAVEPGPQNQSLLLLNLAANGVLTAEVHQAALSDAEGVFRYGRSGANGTILPFDGDPTHVGSYDLVRATTLDRLVGSAPVDMVKIDVEGAEGRVLRGAGALLGDRAPLLVFEFSPPSLEVTSEMSGGELLELLRRHGYSFDIVGHDPARRTAKAVGEILAAFDATEGEHIDLIAWSR
ncbi:MAG: FkbM family methyltransferase [Acidimicrobiales bacterium]